MLDRHTLASMALLGLVVLACKSGESVVSSGADASVATTATAPTTAASSPTTATAATTATTFNVGDTVDVEWSGTWYESKILAVSAGPKYKIHYAGWSDSYDETVEPSRVRARGSASPATSIAASASATVTPPPAVTVVQGNKVGEEMPIRGKCLGGWVIAEEACHRPCGKDSDCAPPTSFCKRWSGKKLCALTGSLVVAND
jgi:hypothetical protein